MATMLAGRLDLEHLDLELIQWLDRCGYDEAWCGEHHSAGSEISASPEIFMAVAIELLISSKCVFESRCSFSSKALCFS